MRRITVPLAALLFASPAAAQVTYPKPPAEYDVQIRYRIRADRDERVRQFRLLESHLKGIGFKATPREDADLDLLDPNAERFAGTIPSGNVLKILDEPRTRTVLFAPAGYKYPDTPEAMVPVRIGLPTGFLFADQQRLHGQVNELLAKLGFREMVSYDHRGYTVVRGSVPNMYLMRLLKDLRTEPSGWFFLGELDPIPEDRSPPLREKKPLRDVLPVRWVEIVPDADTTLLNPPLVAPNRAIYDPALRSLLDDTAARDTPRAIEFVYAEPVEDRVDALRNRLRAEFPRVPRPGGEIPAARIVGAIGNILTIQFGRLLDVERYALEPGIVGIRLPRAGGETIAPATGGPGAEAQLVLRDTQLGKLHAAGYRGEGTRVIVIASGFPNVQEMIGKELPKNTRFVDLTAELTPTLEPLPPLPNRLSSGIAAARAAHAAAPAAQLVLVRVNPESLFQLYTVALAARGNTDYSVAMQARIIEIGDRAEELRLESAAAVKEYSAAIRDLSDDPKPAARRKAAKDELDRLKAEDLVVATRFGRAEALQKSLAALNGSHVVINTLAWESGYPLDGLSGLSQYIDRLFAGDAAALPRSRSATNPRVAFRPLWVQAGSGAVGSVWAGPYIDADGNGAMEFTPPEGVIPSREWTRELNFLAVAATDSRVGPTLAGGAKVRLTVQWRETHDPNINAGPDAIFPLTLRVFRQVDPAGEKRASDELVEVARSVGLSHLVLKEATYGVYETIVEFTAPADGRYAVRIDGREGYDPILPALKQKIEIQPRLFVEFVAATPDKGRPVFSSYSPSGVGVGIPGDAKAALTVAATDKPTGTKPVGATGGGAGLALLPKPDVLAVGALDVSGPVTGSGVASGFAGGAAAVLIGSGVNASDLFRSTGLKRGGPVVIPNEFLQVVPPRGPGGDRSVCRLGRQFVWWLGASSVPPHPEGVRWKPVPRAENQHAPAGVHPMRTLLPLAVVLLASPLAAADPPSYRVLGQDKGRVAVVGKDGKVEWEVECKYNSHDVHLLPNGNLILHTAAATVTEMTPEKKVVWQYVAKPRAGYRGRVEVHAFQRLDDGNTMVAESGNMRLVEVDKGGTIVKEVPLTVTQPDPHRDTRMARKLATGNYLVCHEGDGVVREYDPAGKVVWSYALDLGGRPAARGHGPEGHGTAVYGAVRLANGNTVIGGGNNNRVVEVNKDGKVVWSIDQKELPGITLAWVTTIHALPNGNLIVGNCHAGPDNPQLLEVTRDKKVVWTFKNHTTFGNNLAAAHVLDIPGVLR